MVLRERGEDMEGITTNGPNGMLKKWKKLRGLTFYRVQGCGDIRYENKKKYAELRIVEEMRRMRRMRNQKCRCIILFILQ